MISSLYDVNKNEGHLEMFESFETAAKREVLEETGLVLNQVKFVTAVNVPMPLEDKHYVTIFMKGDLKDDNPIPIVFIKIIKMHEY